MASAVAAFGGSALEVELLCPGPLDGSPRLGGAGSKQFRATRVTAPGQHFGVSVPLFK